MCEVQPSGAFVVKLCQRAFLELGRAIGVSRFQAGITHGAHTRLRVNGLRVNVACPRASGGAGKRESVRLGPFGRIEPAFA